MLIPTRFATERSSQLSWELVALKGTHGQATSLPDGWVVHLRSWRGDLCSLGPPFLLIVTEWYGGSCHQVCSAKGMDRWFRVRVQSSWNAWACWRRAWEKRHTYLGRLIAAFRLLVAGSRQHWHSDELFSGNLSPWQARTLPGRQHFRQMVWDSAMTFWGYPHSSGMATSECEIALAQRFPVSLHALFPWLPTSRFGCLSFLAELGHATCSDYALYVCTTQMHSLGVVPHDMGDYLAHLETYSRDRHNAALPRFGSLGWLGAARLAARAWLYASLWTEGLVLAK